VCVCVIQSALRKIRDESLIEDGQCDFCLLNVRGEERAGELCLERASAGCALGVAAREELVVRHEVDGGEHGVVRGCAH
jgi:hypothetical protein